MEQYRVEECVKLTKEDATVCLIRHALKLEQPVLALAMYFHFVLQV